LIPLAKNIKRFFSFREIALLLVAVIVSVSAGLGVFVYLKKEVIINDDGSQFVFKTSFFIYLTPLTQSMLKSLLAFAVVIRAISSTALPLISAILLAV